MIRSSFFHWEALTSCWYAKFSCHFTFCYLVLLRYIKESEELRRAMQPLELIRRVREIQREAYIELEAAQEKVTKQSAAVDLISRLNNYRSNSDAGSVKALEEWRKRKMERARQRGVGKDATVAPQA